MYSKRPSTASAESSTRREPLYIRFTASSADWELTSLHSAFLRVPNPSHSSAKRITQGRKAINLAVRAF